MFSKAQVLAMTQFLAIMFARIPVKPDFYDRTEHLDVYDYIIVGGGSAGALLANRLSSRPELRVLLVEAGGVENTLTDVPLMASLNLRGPLDWDFWTEPQRNACLALKKKKSPWPRGKVLGGCSAINFMLYVRGNPHDYDLWSSDHGAEGWDFDSVLPFFKKFEAQTNAALAATGMYGTSGELTLSSAESHTELARAFLAAGKELGYDIVDYNGARQIGFSAFQTTTRKGARLSSASAFLKPVAGPTGRNNLHVALSSRATKKIINPNELASLGAYLYNHVWLLTVRSAKEKERLLQLREIQVKNKTCLIIDGSKTALSMKVHWVPTSVPDANVASVFSTFGKIKSIVRDKWHYSGFEEVETTTRILSIELNEGIPTEYLMDAEETAQTEVSAEVSTAHSTAHVEAVSRTEKCEDRSATSRSATKETVSNVVITDSFSALFPEDQAEEPMKSDEEASEMDETSDKEMLGKRKGEQNLCTSDPGSTSQGERAESKRRSKRRTKSSSPKAPISEQDSILSGHDDLKSELVGVL
ncbi:hypothetical protein HPB47_022559 [Ixodes persulcatus]|uniref:Uncharacterized protein n=1 Tax=Ixodes persulcatus TaxID=34615 RepID=A0AC60Q9K4_IXOPE|nr:hypothetical protein HPB47_022559 [Ixodes persulcatus]